MKILLYLFFFTHLLNSQNSIVFKDYVSIPIYPYKSINDSLIKIRTLQFEKQSTDNNIIFDDFSKSHEFYAVYNGDTLSTTRYLSELQNSLPENFRVVLNFLVHWNGEISECKLLNLNNKVVNKLLVEKIARRYRAKPILNEAGVHEPHSYIFSVPIIKR